MWLRTPRIIWGDTWFNLVLGREIARGGLVVENRLTEQGFGEPCVDMQWLAHWAYFELTRLIGIPGIVFVACLLTVASVLAAARFAVVHGGATPGRTLLVGSIALTTIIGQTVVRAQTLSLPFMVALFCVLALDARAQNAKTWWLVPGTVLWANLHGSALLAPVLCGVLGASRLWDNWRAGRGFGAREFGRDARLTLALGLSAFASPYASELPGYYAATLGNSELRLYGAEWQAPSLSNCPEALLLAVLVVPLLVFGRRRLSTFQLLVCAALDFGAFKSARQATPLAYVSIAFLPAAADGALGGLLRFEVDRVLALAARLLLPITALVFLLGVPLGAARSLRHDFPPAFADRVAEAARGKGRLLIDEAHADQLLWFHPELAPRVSHDARTETMTLAYLKALATAYAEPHSPRSARWLRGYDLIVVDRASHPELYQELRANAGWHAVTEDPLATAYLRVDIATSR
jgi:hypothetical protein